MLYTEDFIMRHYNYVGFLLIGSHIIVNTKAPSTTNALAVGDKNDQVPAGRLLESRSPTS